MGKREVIVKESVAYAIAEVAWFIESKGLPATAEKFSDSAYDFFVGQSAQVAQALPRAHKGRNGFKVCNHKQKYTVVFIETDDRLTICEFLPSKLLKW